MHLLSFLGSKNMQMLDFSAFSWYYLTIREVRYVKKKNFKRFNQLEKHQK